MIIENVKQLNTRFDNIENRFNSLETEVKKNSLLLETMHRDIQVIAEVQKRHQEQNDRQHKEMMAEFKGETGLLGTAVRHISSQK